MSSPLETPLMTVLSTDTWHKALSSQVGRDKLFRLIQYVCKLVRGLQVGRNVPKVGTPAGRIYAMEMALSKGRQLWRMAKWVSIYANSPTPSISRSNIVRETLGLISDFAFFAYLVCDNVAFVTKSNIMVGDGALATRRAASFWLVAVIASATAAAHSLLTARKQRKLLCDTAKDESNTNIQNELKVVDNRVFLSSVTLAKHSADVVVAGSLASVNQLHPAIVGIFGAFSSAVGLWQAWPRRLLVSTA